VLFWRVERLAARLFVPYLLWVGFAGALNLSLWLLN
jgi:tryptophan-rich sensory protein